MTGTVAGARPDQATAHTLRHDIQGLRAVAVLVVIASHFGLAGLGGGYVGVDVFFVISGFLITQLLLREAAATGRVSLLGFYGRRARRILPAATLVLVATLVASMAVLSATDGLDVVSDATWATFFAANVHFAQVGTDYFSQGRSASPLQHFWSLSVEEQFYLLWPLVVLGCVLLARRRDGGRARRSIRSAVPRTRLGVVLGIATLASFAYSVLASDSDPTGTYFSTLARAWELGVGCAVALVAPAVVRQFTERLRFLITLIGLASIAWFCVNVGDDVQAAPYLVAIPVVGAGLILLSGVGASGRVNLGARALGVLPLRLVGDWSYSLYLWHWPVLILAQARFGSLGVPSRLGLVGATVALSYLTYRFVETPLRERSRLPGRRVLALYPASAVAVLLTGVLAIGYAHSAVGVLRDTPVVTVANSGIEQDSAKAVSRDPVVALVQASAYAAERGVGIPGDLRPSPLDLDDAIADPGTCDYVAVGERPLCPRGDVEADRTLVVVGDSHARMWISAFDQIGRDLGYRTYYFAKSLCTPADLRIGSQTAPETGPWEDCTDFRSWAFDQVQELRPDVVVLAGAGPKTPIYDGQGRVSADADRGALLQAGWERTLDAVTPYAATVALLRDVPWSNQDAGTCLTQRRNDLADCAFRPVRSHERDAQASVRAARSRSVPVVLPERWLCADGLCPLVVGDSITYTDNNHLTAVYARRLATPLRKALGLS